MHLHAGNMFNLVKWDNYNICVTTTNNVVYSGKLVMGGGHARDTALRWPQAPAVLGRRIQDLASNGYKYRVLYTDEGYCAFQTKYHYNQPSDLNLIADSTALFKALVNSFPEKTFHLAFPGIGLGGLAVKDVWPLICNLPDNVRIWTLTILPEISSSYEAYQIEAKPQ